MKQYNANVCIIAAGPAGLAAAVTAAEEGLSVIVLEKAPTAGGTANMGMGPFGVESRLQKANMINLTKEEVFLKMMEYNHWRVDARKVREYIWKSGSTIDWLEDMGVVFAGAMKYFPTAQPTWHVVQPEGGGRPGPRSASVMNKAMYNNALDQGVEFLFNTPASALIKENGKVVGARANDLNTGEEIEVRAEAVIVATGGFGNNPEMIRSECGYEFGRDIFNFAVPGITGDGVRMVWEAGGAHGDTTMEMVMGSGIPNDEVSNVLRQPSTMVVNRDGLRVMDETIIENGAVVCNIIAQQPDLKLYAIADDKLIRRFRKNGVDYPSGVFHGDPTEGFEEHMEELAQQCPEYAFVADSPEELAEKIGMPVDTFVDTLDEYNDACDEHIDDLFCKHHRYLHALRGKKYYAVAICLGGYGSLGGIKTNYKFEVLGTDNKPIPGLYGAGSDTCDIYDGTYPFIYPGNTMGYAVNSGRLAA